MSNKIEFITKYHSVHLLDLLLNPVEKLGWEANSCEVCKSRENIVAQCSNCSKFFCLTDTLDILKTTLQCSSCSVLIIKSRLKINRNTFSKLLVTEKSIPLSYMLKDLANKIFISNLSKNKNYKGGVVFAFSSIDSKNPLLLKELELCSSHFRTRNIPNNKVILEELRIPIDDDDDSITAVEHVVFLTGDKTYAQRFHKEVEEQLSGSLPERIIYIHYINVNFNPLAV